MQRGGGLRRVNIGSNPLGPGGVAAVAGSLASPAVRVTHLHMGGSRAGDAGATSMARALRGNSCVVSIYLQGNAIGDEGAVELAACLGENRTIAEVHLDGNKMTSHGVSALAAAAAASPSASQGLPEALVLALAMSLHPRLGGASPLSGLEREGVKKVAEACEERVSRRLRVSGLPS